MSISRNGPSALPPPVAAETRMLKGACWANSAASASRSRTSHGTAVTPSTLSCLDGSCRNRQQRSEQCTVSASGCEPIAALDPADWTLDRPGSAELTMAGSRDVDRRCDVYPGDGDHLSPEVSQLACCREADP